MAGVTESGSGASVESSTNPAARSLSTTNILVHGDNRGTIVVGDHNVVQQTVHGALLVSNPNAVTIRRRPMPALRPRPFPGLLGREEEIRRADSAVARHGALNFYAGEGWGKSALLRYLAHRFKPLDGLEGIAYDSAAGLGVEDLHQFLFDAFYTASADDQGQTTVNFKPTPGQLAHHLKPLQALILLDDLELSPDAAEAMTSAAPQCAFLLASKEQVLKSSSEAEPVIGLALPEAVRLLEREVGRPLEKSEQPAARQICRAVDGRPGGIVQAARLIRERSEKPTLVAARLQEGPAGLGSWVVGTLSARQRSVLLVLALLPASPLPSQAVAAITGEREAGAALEQLERLGLVELLDDGYRVRATGTAELAGVPEADFWSGRLVAHFVEWAEQWRGDQGRLLRAWRTLVGVLRLAASQRRWRAVWRLVRALEPALMLAGRWGSWEVVLLQALDAARHLGDRAAEAWCLHQLGARALALGSTDVAAGYLEGALRIRRSLGQRQAAELTRRHLARIRRRRAWWQYAVAAGAAVLIVGGGIMAVIAKPNPTVSQRLPISLPSLLGHSSPNAAGGNGRSPASTGSARIVLDPNLDLGKHFLGEPAIVKTATVRNDGQAETTILDVQSTGEFTSSSHCSGSNAKLQPGRSCKVDVQFGPKTLGDKAGQLTIVDTTGQHTMTLKGSSQPPLQLQPNPLDFGKVPVNSHPPATPVILSNLSSVAQRYTVATTTSRSFSISQSECSLESATLPAHGRCSMSLSFSPIQSGPDQVILVTVTDDYGDGYRLQLTGIGTSPRAMLSPSSVVGFGEVALGSTAEAQTVQLTNTGDAPLTIESVTIASDEQSGGGFGIKTDGCSRNQLAPTEHCTVAVTFKPPSVGKHRAILRFNDNAGTGLQEVGLSGSGRLPVVP